MYKVYVGICVHDRIRVMSTQVRLDLPAVPEGCAFFVHSALTPSRRFSSTFTSYGYIYHCRELSWYFQRAKHCIALRWNGGKSEC